MAFDESHPRHDVILFDAAGNPMLVQDGVATPASTPFPMIGGQHITDGKSYRARMIGDPDEPTRMRMMTEARIAPGSTISLGTTIPEDPSDLVIGFCENVTHGHDMLQDGDPTIINFDFPGLNGEVLAVDQVLIVFAADDFEFDGSSMGPNSSLTNGIELQTVISATTTSIFNIIQNEDFLRAPGRTPVVNNTGPKDILAVDFSFGGLVKLSGVADVIRMRIRDDLTSIKLKYLTATVYAVKE